MIPVIRNGQSFRGAARYYLHDKGEALPDGTTTRPSSRQRVAWVETRNLVHDRPWPAIDEMWRTADDAAELKRLAGLGAGGRRLKTPVKTIALSWHPDERPDRQAMRAAADDFLERMGWAEHQALIVCHTDTRHPHVHIVLNRVHPVTGRALDDGNDRPRAQAWALAYELRMGRILCAARDGAALAGEELERQRQARNRALSAPVVEIAQRLAARTRHLDDGREPGRGLSGEQRRALTHLVAGPDLTVLSGMAGTGKTELLARARRVLEADGLMVVGTALAGIAARNLAIGSGIGSRTIASLEHAWRSGRDTLSSRHVLVVDEAGMVSAPQLARLLAAAETAGAKVVLVGDPEQLNPIEGPALLAAIIETIGAAHLTDIRRQQSPWQRQAVAELASRQTARALARFEAEGCIGAAPNLKAARAALVEAWAADVAAAPEKDRLILAYRRDDVARLNALARAAMRDAGCLGPDHVLATEAGPVKLAVGERVILGRNDRELGVNNGTRATVTAIDGRRIDLVIREAGQRRTAVLDLDHYDAIRPGWAQTIHTAQGLTVDRTYLLATRHLDRHATYVALSRHRDEARLWYARADMLDADQLARTLSRGALPRHVRREKEPGDDIFCAARLDRDYPVRYGERERAAERARARAQRQAQRSTVWTPDRKAARAAEGIFTAADTRLEAMPVAPVAADADRKIADERRRLAERQAAERRYFFAERKLWVEALSGEVYARAQAEWRPLWAAHHRARDDERAVNDAAAANHDASRAWHLGAAAEERLGADRAGETAHLVAARDAIGQRDDMRGAVHPDADAAFARLRERQRAAIRQRQAEASAAFVNERYSVFAGMAERHRAESAELARLQSRRAEGLSFDGERLDALTGPAPAVDPVVNRAEIAHLLDRIELRIALRRPETREPAAMETAAERALRAKKEGEEIDEQLLRFKRFADHARTAHDEEHRGEKPVDPLRKRLLDGHATEMALDAREAEPKAEAIAEAERARRRIETDAALRQAAEAEAEEKRRQETDARIRIAADLEVKARLTDPEERAAIARARHYDIRDPYGSLAKAVGAEYLDFLKEREEAKKAIAAETDPERREILTLLDRANVADFQSSLAMRNARMSEVVTGRFADAAAWEERQSRHERVHEAIRQETDPEVARYRDDMLKAGVEIKGTIGNTQALRDRAYGVRQANLAKDLKDEARHRIIQAERRRLNIAGEAKTQRSETAETLADDTRQLVPWIVREAARMQREERQREGFLTASKAATRTQKTQADKAETERVDGSTQRPPR